jgi:hypothetical protein
MDGSGGVPAYVPGILAHGRAVSPGGGGDVMSDIKYTRRHKQKAGPKEAGAGVVS